MTDDIPLTPSSPDGGATANELLRQVRLFVAGSTHSNPGLEVNPSDVVKSAIFLLKSLPAAREAVLEHLYSVFDEFVGEYVAKGDKENSGKSSKLAGSTVYLVEEINSILTNFIISNPEAWAPIIFNWSLDLLGRLSSKYGDRRGLQPKSSAMSANASDSLNDILNLWMKCQATETLIHLSTQCLSTLMNGNVDVCIDALLDMSVQHAPYFDWFIAHIGSCFPTTIITRVLACGLKDFCALPSTRSLPDKKAPKIASVVEILGHLSAQHNEQIKRALLSMARDSMTTSQPSRLQLAVLPFLLQLASMSSALLASLMPDIIDICLNKNALLKLPSLANHWKDIGVMQSPENILGLSVALILQSGESGSRLLSFLLDTAVSDNDIPQQVKSSCAIVLKALLAELQAMVYANTSEILIFSSVSANLNAMLRHVIGNQASSKLKWVCQLLALFCLHCGEGICCQALIEILRKCSEIGILTTILQYVQQSFPNILTLAVAGAVTNVDRKDVLQLFTNLALLSESAEQGPITAKALLTKLNLISDKLNDENDKVARAALRLIVLVPLANNPDSSIMTKVTYEVVMLIFSTLCVDNIDEIETEYVLQNCRKILSTLSSSSSMLFLILRLLVQGSFSENISRWFGNKSRKTITKDKKSFSLIDENMKHSRSLPLPQSHSTVLYTGVIGNGIRIAENRAPIDNNVIVKNKHYLLLIIRECCAARNTADDKPSIESMSKLSLLMVELVSPDVMFNGLPWPDEDFLKVTMERDLYINKLLEDNPILWDILFLVARTKPALCYCSVLLRGVAATQLSFWSSCQEKITSNCQKNLQTSRRLISLMSLGEFIPPPLSQMGDILSELSPYEAYVVLNDMWKYMSDNVPSPESFNRNEHGEMVRNVAMSHAPEKYTIRLRHIMQSKIHKLGFMYPRMFPN